MKLKQSSQYGVYAWSERKGKHVFVIMTCLDPCLVARTPELGNMNQIGADPGIPVESLWLTPMMRLVKAVVTLGPMLDLPFFFWFANGYEP